MESIWETTTGSPAHLQVNTALTCHLEITFNFLVVEGTSQGIGSQRLDWDYAADHDLHARLEQLPIEQQEAMNGPHPDLLQRRLTDNAAATTIALSGPRLPGGPPSDGRRERWCCDAYFPLSRDNSLTPEQRERILLKVRAQSITVAQQDIPED